MAASFLAKLSGVEGTNQFGRVAFDVDDVDSVESPMTFVATSRVTTTDEFSSRKGAARRDVIGIVHVLVETIPAFDPLQSVRSCCQLRSAAWMKILYAVIADPPLFGAVHETMTFY